MTVAYVLRLVDSALAEGRIAGTAEVVESGEVIAVHCADDLLLALLGGRDRGRPGEPGDPPDSRRRRDEGDGADG